METTSNPIIADSSGLISLLIETDRNHKHAASLARELRADPVSILIPCEVLAETLNILGKKFGHQYAAEAVEDLLQSAAFAVTPSSDIVRRDALTMFRAMTASVSYTDCLVMAMAEQYGTVDIFGFDEVFSKRGYFLPAGKKKAA